MPDWSYAPLLRPIGIALHGDRTRAITLRRLRLLASHRAGAWFIRFLGHMSPPSALEVTVGRTTFPSPVILSAVIDPRGSAARAFAQFEFGAIEVAAGARPPALTNGTVIIERYDLASPPPSDRQVLRCRPHDFDAARTHVDTVLVDVEPDQSLALTQEVVALGCTGIMVEAADTDSVIDQVRTLRREFGTQVLIGAGGYVSSPRQALELRDAGADLIIVGEGLAIAGPGLAQRVSDAFLARQPATDHNPPTRHWLAGMLFSIGIVIAAFIALYLAQTSVIMGYDEKFAQMTRAEMEQVNPHLLHFMSHDRLSYAGATLSLGILYGALAGFGIRRQEQWAFHTFVAAGLAGFATLWLFLAFGYFDIGNAAVHAVLWPFFLAAVIKPPHLARRGNSVDLDNDQPRRRAMIGQLLLVCMSIGLIIGGMVICVVGSTEVFVISDLEFLDTTAAAIEASNERLLPLIAHDRVSFGGAIVCNGLAALLMSLWGFKRGEGWLWWSLLAAGSVNLGLTLYAHFSTGYTELGHLLPVAVGAGFFVLGLLLSRTFLLDRDIANAKSPPATGPLPD